MRTVAVAKRPPPTQLSERGMHATNKMTSSIRVLGHAAEKGQYRHQNKTGFCQEVALLAHVPVTNALAPAPALTPNQLPRPIGLPHGRFQKKSCGDNLQTRPL